VHQSTRCIGQQGVEVTIDVFTKVLSTRRHISSSVSVVSTQSKFVFDRCHVVAHAVLKRQTHKINITYLKKARYPRNLFKNIQ
jgi:hypothetical protein